MKREWELYYEVYRELSELVGEEGMQRIFFAFHGQQISFPLHLYDPRLLRDEVRRLYDGTNAKALAKRFGYSEKTIGRMLK